MKNAILPNPDELQVRRLAIQSENYEKKMMRILEFCTEELTPRIVAANEKLETSIVFSLPADITAPDFESYVHEQNRDMGCETVYVVEVGKKDIRMSWVGRKK